MRKTFRTMGLCTLAVLALAACKKNEQKDTVTLKATLPPTTCESKTEIGTDNWLWWSSGDQIVMYAYTNDETSGTTARNFTVATADVGKTSATFTGDEALPEADYYKAFYPATNVELNEENRPVIHMDSVQSFVDGSFATNTYPMFGNSIDGQSVDFFSPCGVLAIPMKGTANVGRIVLKDKYLQGLVGDIVPLNESDGTNHEFESTARSVTLDCGTGVQLSEAAATTFYFVVAPSAFMGGFTIDVYDTEDNIVLTKTTTNNCMILPMRIRLMGEVQDVNAGPTIPTGALSGYYSVSPTQQVYFAHGNLMCSKEAGTDWATADYTWSFMNHQYDMVETCDGFTLNNHHNTDNIDLYLWGASGIAGTATYYEPWRTTGYEYNVIRNDVGAADMPNTLDWGYNTIETKNGQIQPTDGWRTLTFPEWSYLLYTRRLAGNRLSYGKATITGVTVSGVTMNVKGLIILPDDYYDYNDGRPDIVLPSVPALYYGDDNGNYSDNVLTGAEWDALEQNYGVTFLPAVGWIDPSQSNGSSREWQDAGVYWSSTGEDGSYAEYIRFGSDYMFISAEQYGYYNIQLIHSHRAYGHCVRLAHDVE